MEDKERPTAEEEEVEAHIDSDRPERAVDAEADVEAHSWSERPERGIDVDRPERGMAGE